VSVIWYKVWFDLWHNRLRTLLVVVSIAVGVFAVGATFGMVDLMLPTMDAAHKATVPSHITMYLSNLIDVDTALALKRVPGVEDVELYNAVDVRYKLQPQENWRKGSILMRQDYETQKYDLLLLKAGQWPVGENLSIENMHSPFYGIDVGDQVILEVDGKEETFAITGRIRHPFVPPPSFYDWAWFFGSGEVMERFGIPQGKFSQIKMRVTPYSADYAKEIATAVKERLSKQGISVAATMYQDPAKHWGRSFIDGMSMVIQVLAVLSLLLSVVLVLNTLTAIITQQTNQIGILKAIGGTSSMVTKVYLVGVVFYGMLSLFISLPLGVLASYHITRWFLSLYNIEYSVFTYSTKAVILQALAAIAVPLLAALLPVFHGAGITVREAISSYGLGGDFGSNRLDLFVERIGQRFLASYYANALANTFRRKGRLVLTELVLVIAGVMFLMVMSLSSSIDATLDSEFTRRSHDVIISFTDPHRIDRTVSLAQSIDGVDKAGMWVVAPVTILRQGQRLKDAGMGSQLQGVPLDDPMYLPLIVDGRGLKPGDERKIVMNMDTAEDEHIRVGDTITLDLGLYGDGEWQVVGLYRVFLAFGGGFNIDAIYAPREAVFEATKKSNRASILLVRTSRHGEEDTKLVANSLEDLFKDKNMEIAQTETMPALRKTSDTSYGMVTMMLLVLGVIVALVGAIGLMGSLWISVIERTKEIGVLRAIGASSRVVMGMFMFEGLIQGWLSWLIAVPVSLVTSPLLANMLGQAMFQAKLEFSFNLRAVFTWLVITTLISIVASFIPARKATQVSVRESLAYE